MVYKPNKFTLINRAKAPKFRGAMGSMALLFGLSLSFVLPLFSMGCTNNANTRAPSSTTLSARLNPGLPGLGGGILPSGSTLLPITIVTAAPSVSSVNGQTLDLQGQNEELGSYCPTATDCVCQLEWTPPDSGVPVSPVTEVTYNEVNMVRCSYSQVPSNVNTFTVSIRVVAGGMSSNKITIRTPSVDASKETDNLNNYLKVIRYQCKDVVEKTTNFYGQDRTSLLDPQSWHLSLSFNLYTTSLGADYGGAMQNFECPVNPTDETVVKYSQDRYWPDTRTGPFGIDGTCNLIASGGSSCDCPGIGTGTDTFDGLGNEATGCLTQSLYTNAAQYNSRSRIFGARQNNAASMVQTDGTLESEPYDMALYSTKPLSGHDNIIYPVSIDAGTPTSYGVNNEKDNTDWANSKSFNCSTGTDSTACKCVTGFEKECRRYTANRHDFYVANFYDNTFKYPLCVPHTVGGQIKSNNILLNGSLDCSVDATKNPVARGKDVIGFVALPDDNGKCPTVTRPKGLRKWGLLWNFRKNFEKRKVVDIANEADIGELFCTAPKYECTGSVKSWAYSSAATSNTLAHIVAHTPTPATDNGYGARYCQDTVGTGEYNIGIIPDYSTDQGQRYGNCLQLGNTAPSKPGYSNIQSAVWGDATATTKICSFTDGYTPFTLPGINTNGGAASTDIGGSFRLFTDNAATVNNPSAPGIPSSVTSNSLSGCYDPAVLYFQPFLTLTGFYNFFTSLTGYGCNNFDESGATGTNQYYGFGPGATYSTFDWQGFPFMAGNYTTVPPNQSAENAGVGMGGNVCNPTLPGSRWSGDKDTTSGFVWNAGQLSATADSRPGWGDGIDVWLVGNGNRHACIEADVDADFGFLYNVFAHTSATNYVNRLPGTAAEAGFPGLVENFPKTIKNWFDFVGIGCKGKCDNSSAANSYPASWRIGITYNAGTLDSLGTNAVPTNAIRSGPHSSTDSWGGYGIFKFAAVDLESSGKTDNLYIVSPENISLEAMSNDETILNQYRPVRYINGVRIEYELNRGSQNTTNFDQRLSVFPVCVLQEDGET